MTQEQLKKYIPYIAGGLALVVFLVLIFRPLNKPETPEDPPADITGGAPDPAPAPDPTPDPAPQPQVVTLEAGTPLFAGPGYEHPYLLTVTEAGIYGQAAAAENGWVQIDAPEGWANLNASPAHADEHIVIHEADPPLLQSGDYLDPFPESDAIMPAAVRAQQPLTDLRLVTLVPGATLEEDQTLLELVSLEPGTVLVLRLHYPGSASIYGLSFTDPAGSTHRIVLSESGVDGSLAANKY